MIYHDKSPSPGTQPEKATSDIKPFSELNLIDDYMFDIATMDLEICRSIIELSLNIRIREIRWKEGQKVLHNLPGKRGVRLDFYVEDMEGTIYNVEMQRRSHPALGKRTRFYSALMDAPLLKQVDKGFDRLPRTFLIFICGFDLFDAGKYRYTFQQTCTEIQNLILGDERQIIFLNTKGKNKKEVEPQLVQFLDFIQNSSGDHIQATTDPRIVNMYHHLETLKQRADMEADYMTTEERDRQIREEGREEERLKLLTALISSKLNSGISPHAIAAELAPCFEMEEDALLTRIAEIQTKFQN
ncbi:MAG: Rpn family recombination-promoting nuclease/putative transposase [Lachnospiraceae bacterium]